MKINQLACLLVPVLALSLPTNADNWEKLMTTEVALSLVEVRLRLPLVVFLRWLSQPGP